MDAVLAVPAEPSAQPVTVAERRVTIRQPRRLLVAGLSLGALAEALFDGHAVGISFPLFVFMALVTLRVLAGKESWPQAARARWLMVPLMFFAWFVFVRDSQLLTTLNVVACVLLAGLLAHAFPGVRLADSSLGRLVVLPLESWVLSLLTAPSVVAQATQVPGLRARAEQWWRPGLLALAVTVPLVLLFGALLVSADAVFARLVSWALGVFDGSGEASRWSSLVVTVGAALAMMGLLAHALRRRVVGPATLPATARPLLGAFEGLAALFTLVGLFGAFALVQATCLWVDNSRLLPADLSWGEYARQGFLQLVVTAVLTLALLLVLPRVVRLESASQRTAFASASTALVALTLVMLLSAMKRMLAYEEAYGFTVARVVADTFCLALGAVLVWRAVTSWALPRHFAAGALVAALGYVAALDLLDPEAVVVRHNLQRFAATGRVDEWYLSTLSSDAALAMLDSQLLDVFDRNVHDREERFAESRRLDPGDQSALSPDEVLAFFDHSPVHARLIQRAVVQAQTAAVGGWQAFHLARWRAARIP